MSQALTNYLDTKYLLLNDENVDYEMKLKRDRSIALESGIDKAVTKEQKLQQIRAWRYQQPLRGSSEHQIKKIVAFFHKIKWLAIILGLVFGVSVSSALFLYTGESPINVINFLWIVVGLQLIFVVLIGLFLLPNSIQRWIPGIKALNKRFSQISLGHIIYHISRWSFMKNLTANSVDKQLENNRVSGDRENENYEVIGFFSEVWRDKPLIKWQMMMTSQWFALSFNLMLLMSALYLVVFSDLAFGWSSTIDIEVSVLKSITDTLSVPWISWIPTAVPSVELIENSRYFRALSGNYSGNSVVDVMQLGQWWPFLVCCIIVYGVFPRLLLLIIATMKLRRQLSHGILTLDGASLLLKRSNANLVETKAEIAPEIIDDKVSDDELPALTLLVELNKDTMAYHWFDKVFDDKQYWQLISKNSSQKTEPIEELGMDDCQWKMNEQSLLKHKEMLILIKSWEPPMMTFIDWLKNIINKNPQISIQLLPYGVKTLNNEMVIAKPDSSDVAVWNGKLKEQNLMDIELMEIR